MKNINPDKQKCGNCQHFKRCEWLIQAKPETEKCDWVPSRFVRKREMKCNLEFRFNVRIPEQLNRAIEMLGEVTETNKSELVREWISEGINRECQKLYRHDKAA